MSDEEVEYGLVYPFVVCQSKGGPYEDQAFVAGVMFGNILAYIEMAKVRGAVDSTKTYTVPTPLVRQIDLLAMHYGLLFYSESTEYDEWTLVWFGGEFNADSDV